MPTNLKNQKEEKHALLLRLLSLPKSTRAIIVTDIADTDILDFLMEATKAIGVYLFSEKWADLWWVDAYLTLDWQTPSRPDLVGNVIVPIGPMRGAKEAGFTEFNPMKFEGNSFLFESADKYQIFASIVRYLENVKYPGDKRTLLQNIVGEK